LEAAPRRPRRPGRPARPQLSRAPNPANRLTRDSKCGLQQRRGSRVFLCSRGADAIGLRRKSARCCRHARFVTGHRRWRVRGCGFVDVWRNEVSRCVRRIVGSQDRHHLNVMVGGQLASNCKSADRTTPDPDQHRFNPSPQTENRRKLSLTRATSFRHHGRRPGPRIAPSATTSTLRDHPRKQNRTQSALTSEPTNAATTQIMSVPCHRCSAE
jgi:hypothetical protein